MLDLKRVCFCRHLNVFISYLFCVSGTMIYYLMRSSSPCSRTVLHIGCVSARTIQAPTTAWPSHIFIIVIHSRPTWLIDISPFSDKCDGYFQICDWYFQMLLIFSDLNDIWAHLKANFVR